MFDPFRLLSPSPRVKREREREGERETSASPRKTSIPPCTRLVPVSLCARSSASPVRSISKRRCPRLGPTPALSPTRCPPKPRRRTVGSFPRTTTTTTTTTTTRGRSQTPRVSRIAREALSSMMMPLGSPGGVCALTMMMCFCEVSSLLLCICISPPPPPPPPPFCFV